MTFQSVVNYDYAFGVPGEILRSSAYRAHAGYINSATPANNIFGSVFTLNADGKTVGAGGTGAVWGILSNPKEHASFGGANGPLSPTFALANNVNASFVEFGKICCALNGTKAAVPGAQLQFAQATGLLSIPAVAGTADTGCTLLPAYVEDFAQPNESGNLILVRINL